MSDLLIIVPCVIFVQCGNHEGRVWTAEKATPTIACTGDLYVRAVLPLKNMDIATVSTEFQPVEATCSKEVDNIPPAEAAEDNVSTTLHTFHV